MSLSGARLLLSIPSSDSHSGAARSTRTICKMLAGAGMEVRTEPENFRPDILFGYGGLSPDIYRYRLAKKKGIKVVFSLRNWGYLNPTGQELLKSCDAVLSCSRYLAEVYRKEGVESTALPLPMDLQEVVRLKRDPVFFTMVNPNPEKGLLIIAQLVEQMRQRRPDILFRVVDRERVGEPWEIYRNTRVLLVPSLWQEPAGRVAAEALLNGIPPLVSDRGGLPEVCNGGGFIIPVPPDITPHSAAVPISVLEPWLQLIERFKDDEAFYAEECRKSLEASSIYRPEVLAPRYVEFFSRCLR
jgi:glycosyltransferase involved in cell wall biosynthesis